MGILRSEPMKRGLLFLPVDRARYFIDLLGRQTNIQFEDMNARDMQRPYKKHIQRIDEMERIIRFLMDELKHIPGAEVIKNNVNNFLDHADDYKLDEVEVKLKRLAQDFQTFKENNVKLADKRNAALEEGYVVKTAIASIAQISNRSSQRGRDDHFEFDASRSLLDDEEGGAHRRTLETMFSNVAGVIPQAEQDRFARTLFRATRGNTFTHFQQIPEPMKDPKTGKEVHKSVFVIYFQDHRGGSSMSAMSEKITKICSSYGVNTYRWPSSREAAEQQSAALQVQVQDQDRLLRAHETYVRDQAASLLDIARRGGNSIIEEWRLFCLKEKSIYATLNLFEGNMNLRANIWCPAAEFNQVQNLININQQQGSAGAMLVSDRQVSRKRAPTFVRKNEFTCVFQELVDIYGLPRYQEANPMIFTIVTFPFLFGIMYGDIGHGLMLFGIGLALLRYGDSIKYSMPDAYAARYIVVMMGFFSVYAGFLYNDLFSIGLDLFGSRWEAGTKEGEVVTMKPTYDVRNEGGPGPYPFGVDPAWHGAYNELIFMNSLKMKISVVIGVAQMLVGLFLRFSNAIHMNNMIDFWCECVPMLVFMLCFFGFMDYMILYKWVTPMENPPSIINSMIAMGMWQDDPSPMFGMSIVRILMIMTMLSVPVMLIPKPLLLAYQHHLETKRGRNGHMTLGDQECNLQDLHGDEGHEFDIGEIAIHQIIETIEYVLGTVSHTASYLRLWALSLAHQQLSLVFFQKTILAAMAVSVPFNIVALTIAFAVWFGCTTGILLGMDVMECFLHTLRLHWVEFQTKFYKADGYAFEPYRHKDILERTE